MIEGYKELNENISNTILTIDKVATASKEQERGIVQINDAINMLDQATQKNAQVADQISTMSLNIAQMSDSLVKAGARASFLEDSLDRVSDVDLVYDTALLKVKLLKNKDEVYSKLSNCEDFIISQNSEIDNWLEHLQNTGKNIDIDLINKIKEQNKTFFNDLQKLVHLNATKADNEILNLKAKDIEQNSLKLFENLNEIKRVACK